MRGILRLAELTLSLSTRTVSFHGSKQARSILTPVLTYFVHSPTTDAFQNTENDYRFAPHRNWESTSWRHVIYHLATWSSARGLWLWVPNCTAIRRCVWGATPLRNTTVTTDVPSAYGRAAGRTVPRIPRLMLPSVPYCVCSQNETWRRRPERTSTCTIMTPWRPWGACYCSVATPVNGNSSCRWKHILDTEEPELISTGTVKAVACFNRMKYKD
jgi:hypothetical protein